MPHAALAQVLVKLGFDANARAEAGVAFGLAPPLSQENRLAIEAQLLNGIASWR